MKAIKSLVAAAGLAVLAGCAAENKAINLLQTMEVQKGECVSLPAQGCEGLEFCYLGGDYVNLLPNPDRSKYDFYLEWKGEGFEVIYGADNGLNASYGTCKIDILSFDKDKIRVYWH